MEAPEHHEAKENAPSTRGQRLVSVDALRGFDMFWLVGGTGLGLGIVKLCGSGVQAVLLPQLDHREWAGCTFYDLIFPLFVFVVGLSVVFSLDKYRDGSGGFGVYRRAFKRFVLMFLLGLVYYGGLEHPWPDVRILGVLQRLALCYLFTALLYLHLKPRVLVGVCIAILLAYWALFSFVPVPGTGVTSFAESSNWARYVDELLLPGHKHDGTWDNNGILSTLTSIATCLLGVFAALVINEPGLSQKKKVLLFVAGGLAMAACGWLWGLQFPVIKKIWTSSYVLVTGGYSFALLGAFFLVVDVWGYQKWAEPFIWIGANPLTIYMARNLMDFNGFAERFVGGSVALAVGPALAYFLKTAVSLLLSIVLVRFLYKKKIFLRV